MKFGDPLIRATFVKRLNRFAALVKIARRTVQVHVANSGRMHELLVKGYDTHLLPRASQGRKTRYDLALVDVGTTLVSADARLPPLLVYEAIEKERLAPFSGYDSIKREAAFGESRLDLLLSGPNGKCLVETKSVTLVVDGVGLFPDAPTTRGTRHLLTLAKALKQGYRAAVFFVVQRDDVWAFRPNDAADPLFGSTLRRVAKGGVEVYAYKCRVDERGIEMTESLLVQLA